MPILREYLRPATLAEALSAMEAHGAHAALLAGGAEIIGALESRQRPGIDVLIDLGRLGLAGIHATSTHLVIGATSTLTDVLEQDVARALAGGLLVRAARNEGPVNFRNAATVGGIIAGCAHDSEFYAALLALGATVSTAAFVQPQPLASIGAIQGIITAVQVPRDATGGGIARVARTPADRPIVAAVAVTGAETTRIAYCGLADRPILEGTNAPPLSDFRGSAEYRAAMAPILRERALAAAQQSRSAS